MSPFFADEKRNGGVSFALLEQRSGAHSRTGSVRVVHSAVHRRQSGYGIAISSDSTAKMRCRQRKLLFLKRNKICDLSLALAIVGIALTIIDTELTALRDTKIDKVSTQTCRDAKGGGYWKIIFPPRGISAVPIRSLGVSIYPQNFTFILAPFKSKMDRLC